MIRSLLIAATFFLVNLPTHAQAKGQDTLLIALPAGNVEIKMMPKIAPKHVERIKALTSNGFYDDLGWFRVIEGFIAQTGYPLDSEKGEKGKSHLPDLPAEFSSYKFKRGTVGMGRSDNPDSANSQFFICLSDEGCKDLTGQYTAWGQVTKGMEFVDRLKRGTPPDNPDKTIHATLGK
ncbi:MAG TPA: peptidylprolyl isomerase [Alphaproteobacteria bacterium]|nr:peptidylprolyl isomerase [Alphaproteobacteria bacterium]HNS44653.1 peptidylprolyl isomerase [Alphaproteobacteria bacterium]